MFNLKYTVSFSYQLARQALINKFIGDVQGAARFLAERMRALVPVSDINEPGYVHMRDTIMVVYNTDDLSVSVYVPKHYAAFVEFGHMTVAGTWVPPNPFTRTAVAEAKRMYPWLRIVTMTLATNEMRV